MKGRFVILAVAGLLAGVLLLLVSLSPRVIDSQPPDPARPWMPIAFDLNRPLNAESAVAHFAIEPAVDGTLSVDGGTISFEPTQRLDYNQRYTVTLKAGLAAQNRLPLLLGQSRSFELAPPQLLYLQEREGVVDIWRRDEEGDTWRLTSEVAGVWDYAPLSDGSGLVYSALGESDESIDLMLLEQDGSRRVLLDCDDALCRAPAPQPGGRLIAYERLPLDAGLVASELWLVDLNTGETVAAPVPADLAAAGFDAPFGRHASWSPDGRYLASYRPDANMIVILDFAAQDAAPPLSIPANLETMGGWSADGRLAYTELAFGETEPHEHVDEAGVVVSHTKPSLYEHVVVLDIEGRQARDISEGLEIDEGRPAWHPDGELLAVARTTTGAGRQLFLITLDGAEISQLTDDPLYNHSALAWSPDGRYLAFMRLPRADGSSNPSVMLYDSQTGDISLVAEGAFLPGWRP